MKELIEGEHYYVNESGYVVLTAKYLLERGYCCGNGCLHCPFSYENVEEPRRSKLLEQKNRETDEQKNRETDEQKNRETRNRGTGKV